MKIEFLETDRKESFVSWRFRTMLNWYPMYFGSGGKIVFLSADYRELHVRLRLGILTHNYVGTIFGGSMFSATDPMYMLMLIRIFGDKFVIWDRSASIKFIRPGRETLYAKFVLSEELLGRIEREVLENGEMNYVLPVELLNASGLIHAFIERKIYVATKASYEQKKGGRKP